MWSGSLDMHYELRMGKLFSLNKKMSATGLKCQWLLMMVALMIKCTHWHMSHCRVLHATCWRFNYKMCLWRLLSIQVANLCCGIKGLLHIHSSSIKNTCHVLVRSKVLQWAMCAYWVPWILALGANDPATGSPFNKAVCLQWLSSRAVSTFSVQVMILAGFFQVLQLCLDICRWVLLLRHHPLCTSQWDWLNKVSA